MYIRRVSSFLFLSASLFFSISCGNDTPSLTEPENENFVEGDTWTKKDNMPIGRHSFATSVVNNVIYAIGGRYTDDMLTKYEPSKDSWRTKSPMPTSRAALASGVANGKIYAIGGLAQAFSPALSTVEAYDPLTDTWTKKKSMLTRRLGLGVSVVNGKLYAVGGMTSGSDFWSGAHSSIEVYDPEKDSWVIKTAMPTPRVWLSTSVVDGKIYAIGGASVTKEPLSTVEMYDPIANTWATKSPMPTARIAHAAAVVEGIIYVFGGGTINASPGGFSVVEAYDPAMDTWTKKTELPTPRAGLSANVINNKVYIIGGIHSFTDPHEHGLSTVYEYDPEKDTCGSKAVSLERGSTLNMFCVNRNHYVID